RFDGAVEARYWGRFWTFVPIFVLVHLEANYLFGLYGQMWRYAGVQEARRALLAGASATIVVVGLDLWPVAGGRRLPVSTGVMGGILAVAAFGAIRFQSRLFAVRRHSPDAARARVLLAG